jgi:hypothetical protein
MTFLEGLSAANAAKDVVVPILSALVGAFAAYVPSARLAKKASAELLARDAAARRDAELLEARRLFVKLTIIVNTLGTFQKQMREMIAKSEDDGNGHMPFSQRLSAFAGIEHEESIPLSAEELSVFISKEHIDFVDQLILLSRHYRAVLASLVTFATLKTELHYEAAKRGQTSRDAHNVATTKIRTTAEDANYLKLKAEELEIFTRAMLDQVDGATALAFELAERFGSVCGARFGLGVVPAFAKFH